MPVVAIVGRPNVGKSTLFNRLIGKRKALVSDFPGLTRDRIYAEADWSGTEFTLIDTGGLSFGEGDTIGAKIHKQSMHALAQADVVICLFDGRDGITNIDREIVDIFRKGGKSIVYVANKIDTDKNENLALEFGELGVEVIPISAEHGRNVDEVLERVVGILKGKDVSPPHPDPLPKVEREKVTRIAIVGRPNVGKSTLINRLAHEERVVVHELPGTTRDTIDVKIEYKNKSYIFVDTAGVKKKSKTKDKVDKFSVLKSLRAVDDADIVFVVIDAEEGLTRQDIHMVAHSFDLYKATAVLVNKWDKMDTAEKKYLGDFREDLKELCNIPVLCISGKVGYNCERIFTVASKMDEAKKKRVKTSELNRFFKGLTESHPVPDFEGKQVRLYYITQADINPPVFVVFTNRPKGIAKSYKKYLTNKIHELLGGAVIPIVVKFRPK